MKLPIIFLLLIVALSDNVKEALEAKLVKIKGKLGKEAGAAVFQLNDDEVEVILKDPTSEFFILYFDAELKSSKLLISTWNLAARNLIENDNIRIPMGTVNLRDHKTSFLRLKLYDYPKAVYIHNGMYYNITGQLRIDDITSIVKEKQFQTYKSHPIPKLNSDWLVVTLNYLHTSNYVAYITGFLGIAIGFFVYKIIKSKFPNRRVKTE